MGNLGKLSIHAAIGLLIGIAAIVWIEPASAGGSILLIVVCTAASVIVGAILTALRGRG